MVWDLKDISYDRWNASKLVRELEEEGVPMIQMGQGYASMSAPTKSFLKLVADQNVLNGGNNALRTQLSFTMATSDAAGNVKCDKSKSGARIDGVVASIMALDGLDRRGAQQRKSAYDVGEEMETEMEDTVPVDEIPIFRRSAYDIE